MDSIPASPPLITCPKCGEALPGTPDFFYVRKDTGKLRGECKRCCDIRAKARREANPEKTKAYSRAYYVANYDRISAQKKAYAAAHSEEAATYSREYRQKNAARLSEAKQAYYQKNCDRIKTAVADRYRAADKSELNTRQRAYHKTYGKKPWVKIRHRMSTAIGLSIRGGKSGRSWEGLVGYTLDDLTTHLEALFVEGMTWENCGTWHIDHIRPVSSFDIESTDCDDFRACWALRNLQPLRAHDNQVKYAKWDGVTNA